MKLKEFRKQRGLLQIDVASALGISNSTYAYYERGERAPTFEMLCKMADFFDVSVDELLGRTGTPAMFDDARTSLNPVLEMYNQLTPHQQELIIERMQGFIDGNAERQQQYNRQSAENRATVKYFKAQNTDY